jgi:hypothetical protein
MFFRALNPNQLFDTFQNFISKKHCITKSELITARKFFIDLYHLIKKSFHQPDSHQIVLIIDYNFDRAEIISKYYFDAKELLSYVKEIISFLDVICSLVENLHNKKCTSLNDQELSFIAEYLERINIPEKLKLVQSVITVFHFLNARGRIHKSNRIILLLENKDIAEDLLQDTELLSLISLSFHQSFKRRS